MDKKELVKTIREKAGLKRDTDDTIALFLPNCIAREIEAIIELREIPEDMWFDLYNLIVAIVGNEWARRKDNE